MYKYANNLSLEAGSNEVNSFLQNTFSSLISNLILDCVVQELVLEMCLEKRPSMRNIPLGLTNKSRYSEHKVSKYKFRKSSLISILIFKIEVNWVSICLDITLLRTLFPKPWVDDKPTNNKMD